MSVTDYEAAVTIMSRYPNKCFFTGPRPSELVEAGETLLGVKFPPTYRRFVSEYGAGSFGAFEVYGVIENRANSSVPDGVWCTLIERQESNLPQYLIAIQDAGDGGYLCLDLRVKDAEDECPIVEFHPGFPLESQSDEVIAVDFGSWLRAGVQRQAQRWG